MHKTKSLIKSDKQNRIHPIFYAILHKTPAQVEKMIESGVDVNIRSIDGGKTPLHVATHRGNFEMVQMLLRKKADVMAVTEAGFTPLHVAAQNNQTLIINELVKAGAKVDAFTKVGCTPLHESAANGCEEATLKLLELKADPSLKDFRYNLTPVNLAMIKGHVNIVESLSLHTNYKEFFIQTVNLLLFNWKNKFLEGSLESEFIQKLSSDVRSCSKESDEVFKCVAAALKSEAFGLVKESLKAEKKVLIILMNKYNEKKILEKKNQLSSDGTNNKSSESSESLSLDTSTDKVTQGKIKVDPMNSPLLTTAFDTCATNQMTATSSQSTPALNAVSKEGVNHTL